MPDYKFRDEFTGLLGSAPNPDHWGYDLGGGGWGNGELETYTDSRANSFLDGAGHLVIRALEDGHGGYTSARLKTLETFSQAYGCWEARLKITSTQGLWPAWWAMGTQGEWPACGEVDMVEDYGWGFMETTVHIPDGQGGVVPVAENVTYADQPLDTAWHAYRMWWTPTEFVFHKDTALYLTVNRQDVNWPYSSGMRMYMLLNLAVGGSGAGLVPESTVFPVDMLVDYVRVW